MRRALALIAALGLSACTVDVEGAPCSTAGSTADCPAGQACGVDGKCSERAAGCTDPALRCEPGVDTRCSADGLRIETCVASDPCGGWAFLAGGVDCSEGSLVCSSASGSPRCACDDPGTRILVDLAAPVDPDLAPTGASEPAACRFRTLGAALAYAEGAAPITVRAVGSPSAGAPAVFGSETFPLEVAAGVTLETASSPPAPELWVISAAPLSSAHVVELGSGAAIEGFTLRSLSASGDGIAVACGGGTAAARANAVRIDGQGQLRHGVSVTGTCGLEASDLEVRGAAQVGLLVDVLLADPLAPAAGVTVTGGALTANGGAGAELRAGFLSLAGTATVPFSISGNGGFGVSVLAHDGADGRPYAAVALDLDLAEVSANGEAGILVGGTNLPAESSASIQSSKIHGNLGRTSASEHVANRRAGGVLFRGTPVQLTAFSGNQVYANGSAVPSVSHDQVAVFSASKWSFPGTDCDAGANVYACPASGGYLVYSSAVDPLKYADAGRAYWPLEPAWPPDGLVFHATYAPICSADPLRLPECPP